MDFGGWTGCWGTFMGTPMGKKRFDAHSNNRWILTTENLNGKSQGRQLGGSGRPCPIIVAIRKMRPYLSVHLTAWSSSMTTTTAHPAMQDAFRGITEKTEIVDATGNVIGYYTPREFEVELLYQQAEVTFDPERIRHQMQDPLAMTHRRIIDDVLYAHFVKLSVGRRRHHFDLDHPISRLECELRKRRSRSSLVRRV